MAVLVLVVQLALMMLALAACVELVLRRFDSYGDDMCRAGRWQGPQLCPPERFATGELPEPDARHAELEYVLGATLEGAIERQGEEANVTTTPPSTGGQP